MPLARREAAAAAHEGRRWLADEFGTPPAAKKLYAGAMLVVGDCQRYFSKRTNTNNGEKIEKRFIMI